jgi:formylglycine-generating enzyme required for sulfatase activity
MGLNKKISSLCLAVFTALAMPMMAGPEVHAQQQRPGAAAPALDALEARFWNDIKTNGSATDFKTYLDAFPDGRYVAEAKRRLQEIENRGIVLTPPPPASARDTASGRAVRDCSECPELVPVSPGTFMQGASDGFPFEAPVHQVTIRKPYLIGRREVTFAEWDACVAQGGCRFSPDDRGAGRGMRPATGLSWSDTQDYVLWLSRKTGKTYRLPTESEWEYAARGGTTTSFPWGAGMDKGRANCQGCNGATATALADAGSFPPNAFGLFDMSGNAAEWVEDCWNDSYRQAPTDGSAWVKARCQERVLRGGSYNNESRFVRSASRYKYDYDVRFQANGFRVVREP